MKIIIITPNGKALLLRFKNKIDLCVVKNVLRETGFLSLKTDAVYGVLRTKSNEFYFDCCYLYFLRCTSTITLL